MGLYCICIWHYSKRLDPGLPPQAKPKGSKTIAACILITPIPPLSHPTHQGSSLKSTLLQIGKNWILSAKNQTLLIKSRICKTDVRVLARKLLLWVDGTIMSKNSTSKRSPKEMASNVFTNSFSLSKTHSKMKKNPQVEENLLIVNRR